VAAGSDGRGTFVADAVCRLSGTGSTASSSRTSLETGGCCRGTGPPDLVGEGPGWVEGCKTETGPCDNEWLSVCPVVPGENAGSLNVRLTSGVGGISTGSR